ncbi:hypothetical protein [Nitrosomonas ureae]|uniref:Uncharacterized protein n=1 Tax=Nitrosomonas ureae TaxID=44577 RepID=A0A2T5IRP5_9PROT|nr:hypothetical protein [Nitrosomonas ureae]PTQ86502.1 hypothetical protein C8R28_101078 [Nitrosomonas ureae]
MRNNLVNNNKAITLSLVLICVLASVGLIFLEGMNVGIVFFAGYMVIATISSAFKDKRYYSRRALG